MLIRNYGLFWSRDRIHWGAGKNKGHLKGVLSTRRTSEPIDFREQQGVYVLYDDGFSLVYIGQAGTGQNRLFSRLKQHRADHLAERWSRFSWFGIREVKDDRKPVKSKKKHSLLLNNMLNHIEGILIAIAEPPHNRQGGRFGDDVSQYLQYLDHDNIYPDPRDMIKELYDNMWKSE